MPNHLAHVHRRALLSRGFHSWLAFAIRAVATSTLVLVESRSIIRRSRGSGHINQSNRINRKLTIHTRVSPLCKKLSVCTRYLICTLIVSALSRSARRCRVFSFPARTRPSLGAHGTYCSLGQSTCHLRLCVSRHGIGTIRQSQCGPDYWGMYPK